MLQYPVYLQPQGQPEPFFYLFKVSVREASQAVVHQRRLYGGQGDLDHGGG